jgi:hypothetical protein
VQETRTTKAEMKALCEDGTVRGGFAKMEGYKEPKSQLAEGEGLIFEAARSLPG